jgi:hypothetical protein
LVTTQGTYLSISGIVVYTGEVGEVEEETQEEFKHSGPARRITIVAASASMNKPYSKGSYHA